MSMKARIFNIVLVSTILLFSYQNCQKAQIEDEININSFKLESNQPVVDLSEIELQSISLFLPDSKPVSRAGNTYQINYNRILKIDLQSGQLVESSDLDNITKNYCLSRVLLDELNFILQSSQVCKTQPNLPADMVCTQSIELPYAQLLAGDKRFDLGSASDGCGTNAIDLCEDQSLVLKKYIETIKPLYTQLICD